LPVNQPDQPKRSRAKPADLKVLRDCYGCPAQKLAPFGVNVSVNLDVKLFPSLPAAPDQLKLLADTLTAKIADRVTGGSAATAAQGVASKPWPKGGGDGRARSRRHRVFFSPHSGLRSLRRDFSLLRHVLETRFIAPAGGGFDRLQHHEKILPMRRGPRSGRSARRVSAARREI
jgi:hypothetical protein